MSDGAVRCACIDVGSNTTRLLVAESDGAGRLRAVHEERAFTRIGAALAGGDTIPAAKREEVIRVVVGHLAIARAHGAQAIRGVATAAVRSAADGGQLIAELHARTGLEVTILSDREEARLAFVGAAGTFAGRPPEPLGVLDVGGGSSEVVVGRAPAEVSWWRSLPLGSSSLAATLLPGDPPTPGQLAGARAAVAEVLGAIHWDGPAPAHTLAVGGSATTLCRLAGPDLDDAALQRVLQQLTAAPAAQVAARYDIDPVRARLLPAGLIILEGLGARLGGPVHCGRGGIREGVLLEALAG